jgi:hypothetical protein
MFEIFTNLVKNVLKYCATLVDERKVVYDVEKAEYISEHDAR